MPILTVQCPKEILVFKLRVKDKFKIKDMQVKVQFGISFTTIAADQLKQFVD
jgi:hypothetical protein